MKTKLFALTLVVVLSLVVTFPALGVYSTLIGAVYSGSSGDTPWTHGGKVTVYFVDNVGVLQPCGSDELDANGAYSVDLSACGTDVLHIAQLDVYASTGGDPDSQVRAFYNSGEGDLSMYWYTYTGPTAVSLQSLTATPAHGSRLAAGLLAILIALGGTALFSRRRLRTA